jgi:hypothetical protein
MSLAERIAKIEVEIALIEIEELVKDLPLLSIQLGAVKHMVSQLKEMMEDKPSDAV